MSTSNLETGDMGLTDIITYPDEFLILVRHIHRILNKMEIQPESKAWPSYCFKFALHTSHDEIRALIARAKIEYPDAEFFYIDGRETFDLRGSSGGVISGDKVCYLIKKRDV